MKTFLTMLFILLCFVSACFAWTDMVAPDELPKAAAFSDNAAVCLSCHQEYASFLASDMPSKRKETAFINETFKNVDPAFGRKNCSGCHVDSCMDCHDDGTRPSTAACVRCHSDSRVGLDYTGLGIREDHLRYQRGPEHNGENYMMMMPDIHFDKGLGCADCHSMKSFLDKKLIKQCTDCHDYSKSIIDHGIPAHSNVACVSCHAAWSPNEYGAFYIRFTRSDAVKSYFRSVKQLNSEYVKSSFMRLNTQFALARDAEGVYVPIRPMLVFYTHNHENSLAGRENNMLSNRWGTFTPHTVRRETVLCGSCHGDRRRYLLETANDAYLMPDLDGLPVQSFWNSAPFTLQGGNFVTEEEFTGLSNRNNAYVKAYLNKIEQLKKVVR